MVLYTEFIYVVTDALRMLSYVKAMYYGLVYNSYSYILTILYTQYEYLPSVMSLAIVIIKVCSCGDVVNCIN